MPPKKKPSQANSPVAPKARKPKKLPPKARNRGFELRNTSNSDYELIVSDAGKIKHFWMTPNKAIHIPLGPLTPQIQEFERRHMLSVTKVTF